MTVAPTFPAMSLAAAHAALTQPGSLFEIEERTIRGVLTRVWKNAPPTLREAFLAGRMPKKLYASASSPLTGVVR